MTILSALSRLYDRMKENGEAPSPGYSSVGISFAIVFDANGMPLRLADKRSHAGKKPAPVHMRVPAPPKDRRGQKIVPGDMWDPSPYSLGVSQDEEGRLSLAASNADVKFAAFRDKHLEMLARVEDPALGAFRRFLSAWQPDAICKLPGYSTDILNANIVFELHGDGVQGYIHDRPEVHSLIKSSSDNCGGTCLVTGESGPIARLHPMFGGISDKQAALVSFNIGSKDIRGAASSLGKAQGENAPVSQRAAFAYGTALNALLARDSNRRLRIGDSTVVFWAEANTADTGQTVEFCMSGAFNPPADDDAELARLRAAINDVANGRPAAPELDPETRVYMLGLAPNAARLSVRFWHPGTFGDFARHVSRFWEDLRIEPAPWKGPPAAWSLLYETAIRVGGKPKADTIPPLLGGQLMRAVLTGQALPRTLLSSIIARIRADGDIGGRRAAICKAVINSHLRSKSEQSATRRPTAKEEIPVSLECESRRQIGQRKRSVGLTVAE